MGAFQRERTGVLNVRRSSIGFEISLDVFQCYRFKVVSLQASVEISCVHLPIFCVDKVTMKMAVDVASIMANNTTRMHWNVSEDKPAKHGAITMVKICSANVVEVLKIKLGWKAVVVASNKHFSPIEALQKP
jgi:hypothetical protein